MTKPTKWFVHPAKTQFSLGIRPVWSESSLPAWRKLGSLATHWTHSEASDQTRRMPRLIWVFAGRTCHIVGFVTRRLKCLMIQAKVMIIKRNYTKFSATAAPFCIKLHQCGSTSKVWKQNVWWAVPVSIAKIMKNNPMTLRLEITDQIKKKKKKKTLALIHHACLCSSSVVCWIRLYRFLVIALTKPLISFLGSYIACGMFCYHIYCSYLKRKPVKWNNTSHFLKQKTIKLQAMQDAPPLQLYPASDKFLMWNQRKAALAFFFQTLTIVIHVYVIIIMECCTCFC